MEICRHGIYLLNNLFSSTERDVISVSNVQYNDEKREERREKEKEKEETEEVGEKDEMEQRRHIIDDMSSAFQPSNNNSTTTTDIRIITDSEERWLDMQIVFHMDSLIVEVLKGSGCDQFGHSTSLSQFEGAGYDMEYRCVML